MLNQGKKKNLFHAVRLFFFFFCLCCVCKINRDNEAPHNVESRHCAAKLQVVNSTRSRLPGSSRDTVGAKTNRPSDEMKGGAGARRILKKQQMTFFKFSSLFLVTFLSPRLLFAPPLMAIYLVGKGLLVLTGESSGRMGQESSGDGRDSVSAHKEYRAENISSALVSQVTTTVSLAAVMELKLWPQTVGEGGGKKRITCQYLFPQAAWIETDTLHSLSPPPPPTRTTQKKASSRALLLFERSRGLEGVAWER